MRTPLPLLLLLPLAVLAGCGARPSAPAGPAATRYAEPTSGLRAQLTFYVPQAAHAPRPWSAWVYQEPRRCRGPAAVALDEARASDRDVRVPAGQPLTFRLVVRHGGKHCDVTATFTPEPDRHYVADFTPPEERCTLRVTDYMYQGRGLPVGAIAVSYIPRQPQSGPGGSCSADELPGTAP